MFSINLIYIYNFRVLLFDSTLIVLHCKIYQIKKTQIKTSYNGLLVKLSLSLEN